MNTNTIAWANKALKAVNKLIVRYKKYGRDSGAKHCPFCKVFLASRESPTCQACPWVVFKGIKCMGHVYIKGEYSHLSEYEYTDDSVSLRLRRLYGWRKRLENMIKKFEKAK